MNNRMMYLDEVRESLFSVVREAGEIVEKYFTSGDFLVEEKSALEVVTKADTEVDRFLFERLSALYPEVEFLTEETAPADFSHLREAAYLWVIDPIDGTTNFSRKYPHFGISVALVRGGKPVLGVVYDPLQRCFYWAQDDKAWAYRNETRIAVAKTGSVKEAVLFFDWPYSLEGREKIVRLLGIVSPRVRQIKTQGCAVLDIASVAEGLADGYLHTGLKPWDVAAVSLIVEKAGGRITKLDGSEWDIFTKGVVVSNGVLHEELVELVRGK